MSMDLELSGLNIHRGVLSLKLLAEKKRIKKTKNQSKHPKLHKQKTKKKKTLNQPTPQKAKTNNKSKTPQDKIHKTNKKQTKKEKSSWFFFIKRTNFCCSE